MKVVDIRFSLGLARKWFLDCSAPPINDDTRIYIESCVCLSLGFFTAERCYVSLLGQNLPAAFS